MFSYLVLPFKGAFFISERRVNMEQNHSNPLATEPVGKLLLKFSVPTALTLMVNYMYNIVDQIFVGQKAGYLGIAATNVAFPLSTICVAIALLIGRRLRRKHKPASWQKRI